MLLCDVLQLKLLGVIWISKTAQRRLVVQLLLTGSSFITGIAFLAWHWWHLHQLLGLLLDERYLLLQLHLFVIIQLQRLHYLVEVIPDRLYVERLLLLILWLNIELPRHLVEEFLPILLTEQRQ